VSPITEGTVFSLLTVAQVVISLLLDLEPDWTLLDLEVRVLVSAFGVRKGSRIKPIIRENIVSLTITEGLAKTKYKF
jgi:hypothetical protein